MLSQEFLILGAGDKAGSNGYAHVDQIDAGGAVLRDQTVITLDFSPPDVEGLQLGGCWGSNSSNALWCAWTTAPAR